MTDTGESCGGHAGLPTELRALALAALDRVTPLLDRLRLDPATDPATSACASCPVCAVLAALRGERPELAVRLAEQATGLVAVLRAALEEGDPEPAPAAAPEPSRPPSGRTVQHIPVLRVRARR